MLHHFNKTKISFIPLIVEITDFVLQNISLYSIKVRYLPLQRLNTLILGSHIQIHGN